MFQTFISRHNSNFFSDKLVLTSVTPASSAPVLQTPKATSSTLYFDSLRSEERFSRNAETDLVCRLLLEKKKVYADWLEGQGDALRAEFLLLQRALDMMEPRDPA